MSEMVANAERAERQALLDEVVESQCQVLRACRRAAHLAWRRLDLPCCQLKALVIVADVGFIGIGSLGERMGLSRPRASEMVSQLVERGLVTRSDDAADRRRTHVQLTAEGTSLLEDLFPNGQRALPAVVGRLADPDLVGLARGLRALAQELEGSLAQHVVAPAIGGCHSDTVDHGDGRK